MTQKKKNTKPLNITHPHLVDEWHPTKNDPLTPSDVSAGSSKKVWWKCPKGTDHIWSTKVKLRALKGYGCAACRGLVVVPSTSLATRHPEIAKEWHPTKNDQLTPLDFAPGSNKKVWWKCPKGDDHEWISTINNRIACNSKCPVCSGDKATLSNCLSTKHPKIAAEWHPTKNGDLTPFHVVAKSNKKVWWKCPKGEDHEWIASIDGRVRGFGCSVCTNFKVVKSNSLATLQPEISNEWHPTKNGELTPSDVVPGSSKKVWWKCPKGEDHEWETKIVLRSKGNGCPICRGLIVVKSNCLATCNPDISSEWHPTKNDPLTPFDVVPGSNKKVWWKCLNNSDHIWKANIYNRVNGTKCPYCFSGWNINNIRLFVRSLLPHIENLNPAELYVIFQQNGISTTTSKSKSFLKALQTGKFPKEELNKFCNDENSLVDEFINDSAKSLDESSQLLLDETKLLSENDIDDSSNQQLPLVETKDVLTLLDDSLIANIDQEAISFFVDSATAKIWRHVFFDESAALIQLESYDKTGKYSEEVKRNFLEQYNGSVNLPIPKGYNFKIDGKLKLPNLMQRFTAFMLLKSKRFGNWSGTGAGKTLSAILSSRVIDAKFTIICCPNSVVEGWEKSIKDIYPISNVYSKELNDIAKSPQPQYLILNYEFFQQPNSESKLKNLLKSNKIDLIVIDEIHYSKQRTVEDISKRKKVISGMIAEANTYNENLHVLGMSATPVINNLFEGKTLIEMITSLHHDELKTTATIGNCIALYQKFVSYGLRWIPQYKQRLNLKTLEVDCTTLIEEIKDISLNGSMVDLESVLTKAKIPEILKHIKPKTIVYTHYIKNILPQLQKAIEENGWKVSVFSGEDKSGFDEFLNGNTDVLIATSCIGTGVDGLQNVCDRIIINTLPWTNAEFEQLKGRVYRQGQKKNER